MHVLFLVEDVSFTTDSRVRRETSALRASGVEITVICPANPGEPSFERDPSGVQIYRYVKPALGQGVAAHLLEYAASLLQHTRLTWRVARERGFDVIHVANPPDILWMVALPYKLLTRARFVYDQHDVVPELFEVRYAARFGLLGPLVRGMERASYALADHVIVTTESFRRLATTRGGRDPDAVSVVRNGPRLSVDFPAVEPDRRTSALAPVMVGYLGHMNPQDHLEKFLEMADIVRNQRGRRDVGFVMVGSGDSWEELRRERDACGLAEAVLMPGRVPWPEVLAHLAACAICVQPDPPTVFNSLLAHNKLMEYMALGKACVAFDMEETRVSGGDCVCYVPGEDAIGLAEAVLALADDPARREALGRAARRRIEEDLCWERQAHHLIRAYTRLLPAGALAPLEAR